MIALPLGRLSQRRTALALCLLLSGCTSLPPNGIPGGAGTPKPAADAIAVYRERASMPAGSVTIGEITVRGDERGTLCDHATILASARRTARAAGADAIYLTVEEHPDLVRACWRITASLIRHPTTSGPADEADNPDSAASPASGPAVVWGRAIPEPGHLLALSVHDRNPSSAESMFERAADAIFRVVGNRSNGSGFFIARDGLAITSHHVVAGQTSIRAVLRDGREVALRVMRSDSLADVALVQADCSARACHTLDLATGRPRIGRDVHVIGNPMSFEFTLTRGIVSGIRHGAVTALLQTDAAINHGNSGGPILDAESREVLAIVAWKVQVERTEGLGFGVISADAIRRLGVHYVTDQSASK